MKGMLALLAAACLIGAASLAQAQPSDGEYTQPGSFRGISWGEPLAQVLERFGDMERWSDAGDPVAKYWRPNEPQDIEGVPIVQVVYSFTDQGFFQAEAFFDYTVIPPMQDQMFTLHGEPHERTATDFGDEIWTWRYPEVTVELEEISPRSKLQGGYVRYTYEPIAAGLE